MTHHGPEVEVLLGLGGTYRRVPLASLAAITRIPSSTLRESLSRLVLSLLDRSDKSSSCLEGEPTEGENGSVGNGSDGTLGETVSPQKQTETVTVPPRFPNPSEPSDAPARPSLPTQNLLTGAMLAEVLDDPTSRPFYDSLVATVDPRLLAHALDETLARRHLLRGSPGGYFTAVIRRLAPPPSRYARTPPTPA